MKGKTTTEIIIYILILLIIAYVLWFVLTHSNPVTLSDLITVWASTLAIFGLIMKVVTDRINSFEREIKNLGKELSYVRGRINAKSK